MAYKVIILYRLYMPSYFLGTFAEYPNVTGNKKTSFCHRAKESVLQYRGSCNADSFFCIVTSVMPETRNVLPFLALLSK